MAATRDILSMNSLETTKPVVSINDLQVKFKSDGETVIAVNKISFNVHAGETVCLVGESGSGKSVTSLSLMRLVEFSEAPNMVIQFKKHVYCSALLELAPIVFEPSKLEDIKIKLSL